MEVRIVRNKEEFDEFLRWYEDDRYQEEGLIELVDDGPSEYPSHVSIDTDGDGDITILYESLSNRIESLMEEIKMLMEFK